MKPYKSLACAVAGVLLLGGVCGGSNSATEKYEKLHREAIVVDLHSDTPQRFLDDGADFGKRSDEGHMDIPRLIEGGVDAQVLAQFSHAYAPRFVDGRTVVFVLSDGYDSDGAGDIGASLQTLKRRGCKIVWLNPLKGWKDYEPITRGMAAAMPHLDGFFAANTLGSLAALEEELERL